MRRSELSAGDVLAYSPRRDGKNPSRVLLLDAEIYSKSVDPATRRMVYRPAPGHRFNGPDLAARRSEPLYGYPALMVVDFPDPGHMEAIEDMLRQEEKALHLLLDGDGQPIRGAAPEGTYLELLNGAYLLGPWDAARQAEHAARVVMASKPQDTRAEREADQRARYDAARTALSRHFPGAGSIAHRNPGTVSIRLETFEELVEAFLKAVREDI